ncbi:RING finger protein 44-like [Bufo bufo]|uniref:RING finger protein 44-like n=1 Tax=Bufo bufo TaxID=8384 RepID=UPI001ABEA957|nr:RING finger protein 44-like [Bufo bufo]
MGSRELRQLNADNNAWLGRPENEGQTITLQRLRSAQRRAQDTQHPDVSGFRAPPRQLTSARERSRSPIRPAPAQDPRPSGGSSWESAEAITPEFHHPRPIPPSRRTREIQPPRRSPIHPGERLYNILIQLQRMGTMRPQAIPPPEPPTPAPLGVPHQPPPSCRTQQIGALPTITIKAEEPQSCIICLTDFTKGEQVTSLPCGHIYHHACITQWLQNNRSCPLCRRVAFN